MYIVIDIGNTRIKLGFFDFGTLKKVVFIEKYQLVSDILSFCKENKVEKGILSAVGSVSVDELNALKQSIDLQVLSKDTLVPLINLYKTPSSLGMDRVAVSVAGGAVFPNQNVLIIDAGSCITYDFVTKNKEYLGGAISPGIRLRYKALNDYTAKLPLLETMPFIDFIGKDTESSIHSGIVNGVCNEIEGVVKQYKDKYKELTVILTGGDAIFLSKQLKSTIFANENFLLEGLYKILIHNIENDKKNS